MKEIDLLKERNDKIDWFSLRNQAAMVNAAAILGNNEMITRIGIRSEIDREDIHTTIAKCAIEHADSLINELQKPQFLKQGEQKPANDTDEDIVEAVKDASILDMVEPKAKFHEGDWVIFAENHNSLYQVERIDNYRYYLRHYLGGTLSVHFDDELVRKWTIQDAKGGDVVFDKSDGTIGIFQSIGHHPDGGSYNDPSYCFLHCRYDDGFFYADFEDGNTADSDDIIPATKEQCELLFQKMKKAGYEWDTNKKELKKIEQASAWSEDDEEIHRKCICAMRASACGFPEEEKFVEQVDNWFKSLKDRVQPQNTWKPSDEQMEALANALSLAKNCGEENAFDLRTLYEQLKKLREE